MIGTLVVGFGILVAVVLQSTSLHGLGPAGTTPDLVLCLTLLAGLQRRETAGAAAGFWGGMLVGAVRGGLEGPMAALYVMAGWLAGTFQGSGLLERAAVVATATVMMALGEAVMISVFDLAGTLTLTGVVGLVALHTALVLPLTWPEPVHGG